MNNTIKAQFFAQYLGQRVYTDDYHRHEPCLEVLPGCLNIPIYGYLLLRSIEQLTDEEIITVASLVCARHNRHYKPEDISYQISKKRRYDINLLVKGKPCYTVQIDSDGLGFVDYYMGGAGSIYHFAPGQYAATDYMRSIGIALPYTYLNEENKPITLTVPEQIEKGWVKIKGND